MNEKHFYDFDGFRIDAGERVLLRDGQIVALTQKAFDVLLILVEGRGRIVTKDELMNQVWPDAFVEEGNLSQNIYTLRKMLGETPAGDDYIKTVPRRGYRFAATVKESWEGDREINIPTEELFRLVELKKQRRGEQVRLGSDPGVEAIDADDLFFEEERAIEPDAPAEPSAKLVQPVEAPDQPVAPVEQPRRRGKTFVFGAALLLLAFFGIVGWFVFRATESPERFQNIYISNLTASGNVQCVAVSPDGKYVVYGVADSPRLSSLRVTQLATSMTQTIVQPEETQYHAITISPDGGYVYFVSRRADAPPVHTLYRVPLLGGTPQKILDHVQTAIAFSPDGKQFAFRRTLDERREAGMFVANADGSNQREIAAIKYPSSFNALAWSPDGKVIASAAGHAHGGQNMYAVAVSVGDWAMRAITPERWRWMGPLAWLPDSSGLVMVGSVEGADPLQVWQLSYPSGEARKITNDSNDYNRLSMSADARVIAVLQQKHATSLWIAPAGDLTKARQITFGAGGYRGKLSFTPDGRIVYDSKAGDVSAISVMNADGSNQRQITGDASDRAMVGYATATPDGRYVLYNSDVTGARHIWRMDIDGGNPVQLTRGTGEDHPTCSPDGKWVVFTAMEAPGKGNPSLWKVSIDGGEPVQVTDAFTNFPSISPDGKMIACFYSPAVNISGQLAIYSFDDHRLIKVFPQPINRSPYIRWTPDGRGLIYAENPVGPSKLWMQPIEGGAPKKLIELDDSIYGFDWSRDGKQLAYVRGFWSHNVVVVRDGE